MSAPSESSRFSQPWGCLAVLLLTVLVPTALILVAQARGYTVAEKVDRAGVASITSCRDGWFDQYCPATVRWDDGETSTTTVRSKHVLSGEVRVSQHRQLLRGRSTPTIVVAEGYPTKATLRGELIVFGIPTVLLAGLTVAGLVAQRRPQRRAA